MKQVQTDTIMPMDKLSQLAIGTLSPKELKSNNVYLDERVLKANDQLEFDSEKITVPWNAVMAFVDLQPTANWGHDCRYLLINVDTGELQSIDAQFPPFLRGAPKTLRVIWQGENVPDWTLAC